MFAQCDDDKDDDAKPQGFTATVDGKDWKVKNTVTTIENEKVMIVAVGEDGSTITINLDSDLALTYTLDSKSLGSSASWVLSDKSTILSTANQASAGGEVSIDEINEGKKTITGTFKFEVAESEDKKAMIEGKLESLEYM